MTDTEDVAVTGTVVTKEVIVASCLAFSGGLVAGFLACLFFIPSADLYDLSLRDLNNEIIHLKAAMSRYRSNQEWQDMRLKWYKDRLDNHSNDCAILNRTTKASLFHHQSQRR